MLPKNTFNGLIQGYNFWFTRIDVMKSPKRKLPELTADKLQQSVQFRHDWNFSAQIIK